MALCNDGHGSARRHRDLNGVDERFEFPRGSRPPGMPGGCVTELLLGLKTPLVAANGIGVAAPALAGMPDRIKVEPVTGSCQLRPCHGRLMPKRRHLIVVGSRSPGRASIACSYPLDSRRPHKSRSVAEHVCSRPFRLALP